MNLSVNNRSKKERKKKGERYLSAGGGGYMGRWDAQGFGWNVKRLLPSGDQFLHYSLLLPLPSSHGMSAVNFPPPSPLHTCIHMHFTLLSPYRVEFKKWIHYENNDFKCCQMLGMSGTDVSKENRSSQKYAKLLRKEAKWPISSICVNILYWFWRKNLNMLVSNFMKGSYLIHKGGSPSWVRFWFWVWIYQCFRDQSPCNM